MSTPKRQPPCAPDSQNPTCGMCGEVTELVDDYFRCNGCRCTWGATDFHLVDGEWDDDGPQCPATVSPYAGSIRYPRLAKIVERCLLTEGHDPAIHRNGNRDWTDDDTDGYLTREFELAPSAEALGIPPA